LRRAELVEGVSLINYVRPDKRGWTTAISCLFWLLLPPEGTGKSRKKYEFYYLNSITTGLTLVNWKDL